ncbi:MAG TPA: ParB/RepB/Spo0J family partition protein [Chloroflexota bacterium]|jgi:ParB-like chromosome segregation protein Spo0J
MTQATNDLTELVSQAQLVPLSSLRPAVWNPRVIRSERMKNLMRSIERDPDMLRLRPVLARLNGEIYAGNQRYLACQQLGRETIWAHLEDVSEQVAKERALRDNNEWGAWDDDKLRDMVADLKQLGSDVALLGFDDKELQALMGGRGMPAPGDADTDATEHLFGVVVTCSDEAQQVELLERLTEEGYDVRALVS